MTSPESENSYVPLPKIALVAVTIGLFVGTLSLIAAILRFEYALGAIVPIAAALTILRRRAWGGYGFAFFQATQSLLVPVLWLESTNVSRLQIATILLVGLLLAVVFFLAGRALTEAGASRGPRWPWILLTAALTLPLLFVRPYSVSTGSMENTLLVGDYLLVRVFPKPTVARGDLITFHYPIDRKEIFIKRIIGLAGDRVRIKDRVTFVNDHELREPYVIRRSSSADDFRDNLPNSMDERALAAMPALLGAHTEMLSNHVINGQVVVPPNKYFVLGDNRDNSLDSRYWGFVDEADLIGEPFLIYDSQERGNAELVGRPFKTHTRWARLCKVL